MCTRASRGQDGKEEEEEEDEESASNKGTHRGQESSGECTPGLTHSLINNQWRIVLQDYNDKTKDERRKKETKSHRMTRNVAQKKTISLGLCVDVFDVSLFSRRTVGELVEDADAALLVLLARHPERLLVLHDVGQDGAADEDHVLAARRGLDADLEFLHRTHRQKETKHDHK